MSIVIKKLYEIVSRNMEGNRNEKQEKGAEIRAILSFRDRSVCQMEEQVDMQFLRFVVTKIDQCQLTF